MTALAAISLSKRHCHEVLEAAYALLVSSLSGSEDVRVSCPWETIAVAVLGSVSTMDPDIVNCLPSPQPNTAISFTVLAQKLMQQAENCLLAEDFASAWTFACAAQRIAVSEADSLGSAACYHLGRVLDIGFNLTQKALQMYEAGLSAASEGSLLHTSLSCLYAETGQIDRARSLLAPATTSPHSFLAAGYLHSVQGDWQQALLSYQQAGNIDQAYYQAVLTFNQATACDNLNDLSTARSLYQSLLKKREIGTIPLLCYRNLALLEYREGDIAAATRLLKAGIRLGKKRWSGTKALAELLERLAELLDSRETVKKARLLSRAGHIYPFTGQ